jgi:hydrophobe/amphiphile efflux-1 (HAE1) family protein
MQWLAEVCVKRPVFTWVLMLVILVIGMTSYRALGLDKYPKIDFPAVVITTRLDGAAPEEVESEVTDKIEESVNTISGIDELRSTSYEGLSLVVVTFTLEKDPNVAAQEVRDKINNVLPNLPKGIDQPVVARIDPDAAPVLYITLHGDKSIRDLTELADKKIRRQIESISGVGQVNIVGGTKREVKVWLDPIELRARDLTPADVSRAIAAQNLTVPGGAVETGPEQLTLRVEGRVPTVDALGRIVIRERDGHATRIEDVAKVEDGAEDETTWAAQDGQRVVVLSVRKQSGENTVGVVDGVKARLDDIQKTLPPGTSLEVIRDNSATVRTSVDAVIEHLVLGSVLAAIVVLLFLGNARSTIIAAIAIPVSVIGSFTLMYLLGFTLNFMTLLALALAVGIVIDDAIVVLENIVRFVEEKKLKPEDAAIAATKDIGLAVLATTLSLLAVFIPVSFMSGIVGRFLRSFGLTMACAIFVSLIVSFTLTPMLSARWLKVKHPGAGEKKPFLERLVDVFYRPIERVYMAMLGWVMRHRWVIVSLSFASLASLAFLFPRVPKGFLPENDDAQFEVNIRAPEGTSVQGTRIIADRIAGEIGGVTGVEHTLMTIGDNDQKTPNVAKVYVRLVEPSKRKFSQREMMNVVREQVLAHQRKDLRTDVSEVSDFGNGGSTAAIQYTLSGPDLERLTTYSTDMLAKMRKIPGAVDVDSNFVVGRPELRVAVDRERAADLGVDVQDVSSTLQLLVAGLKVSTFADHGEEYDVRARALGDYRADARGLSIVTVPSKQAGRVPLDAIVQIRPESGPSQINRLGRQRQVTLTCNVAPGVGESTVTGAIEQIIKDEHLSAGYEVKPAGRSRETGRAAKNFLLAFGITFVFMYLVLAAQFESWLHPITILICLPLTIPFAMISLLMFGQGLNIFSALGLLVLFGVVKKNSILQVDHTNHLRAEGMPRDQAILQSNKDRLRPILMTTIAFVAGMLPLVFSRGVGSGNNRGISGVIVGGQVLSLLLTLLATPVFYSIFDDIQQFFRARFGGRASVTPEPSQAPAE